RRLAGVRLPPRESRGRAHSRSHRHRLAAVVRVAAAARQAGRCGPPHRAATAGGLPGRGASLRLVARVARRAPGVGARPHGRDGGLAPGRGALSRPRAPRRRAAAGKSRSARRVLGAARVALRSAVERRWAGPTLDSVFADQTWMAFSGRASDAEVRTVWQAVKGARDAAVGLLRERWQRPGKGEGGRVLTGAEVDDAARSVIRAAGYAEYFVHRTGHSIDRDLHGSGPHIDNFETADE